MLKGSPFQSRSLCRFAQIPDFGRLYWLSFLAALMGYGYVSSYPFIEAAAILSLPAKLTCFARQTLWLSR